MNKSDSERVAAVLEKQGYKFTDNKFKADLVVVNTCGVRQSAEDRVYGMIPKIKEENRKGKIILTGCLVGREDVKKRLGEYVDLWLPITKIFNFSGFARSREARQFLISNKLSNVKCQNYLSIKPKYQSDSIAFVPIGNGCNNFCSYCVVPYARGREVWRPAEEVIDEVQQLVEKGYKEIILIAQNVNSYISKFSIFQATPDLAKRDNFQFSKKSKIKNSKSRKINFAELLKLINNISGDFQISFATSHPKDMSDELIKTMAECQKVKPYVHLPVQSGDNVILKKMNRKYTARHYVNLIKKIRAAFKKFRPGVKVEISTDIIVGFPGETKKQFSNTVKLCKFVKFDKAYVARYSPRPGTAAHKLKDNVTSIEKKNRWMVLEKLVNREK